MSTKSGIVVCRASYRKVFSASFRRMSFSTATLHYTHDSLTQFHVLTGTLLYSTDF